MAIMATEKMAILIISIIEYMIECHAAIIEVKYVIVKYISNSLCRVLYESNNVLKVISILFILKVFFRGTKMLTKTTLTIGVGVLLTTLALLATAPVVSNEAFAGGDHHKDNDHKDKHHKDKHHKHKHHHHKHHHHKHHHRH
jgi:hypothetical protein